MNERGGGGTKSNIRYYSSKKILGDERFSQNATLGISFFELRSDTNIGGKLKKKQRFDSKKKDVWMMNERGGTTKSNNIHSLLQKQEKSWVMKRFSQDAALGVSFFELKE